VGGKVSGLLQVYGSRPHCFDEAEVSLLGNLAGEIALGMGMLRSRQALAQNEAMLLQAQRLARIGHFTFDAATDTLTGSPTHNEILGVPPDEIMNTQSWLAVVHPEDRQRTAAYSRDHVFRGRQPFDSEYRIIRRDDGEERWIQTAGQIVIGPDGRVSRLFGTSQDITERKQFEQRLRQNEAALREAQAIAHLGSWRLDIRSEQLTWSEEVYRIFGVRRNCADPRRLRCAHSSGRPRAGARRVAGRPGGKPYDNEHASRSATTFAGCANAPTSVSTMPASRCRRSARCRMSPNGTRPKSSCASCRWPSSRARTASSSPIPNRRSSTSIPPSCATPATRGGSIGQNPRILKSGKTLSGNYDQLWQTLARGEIWQGEFVNQRKDGTIFEELAIISPVRQPDGRVTHYLGIKEDITEKNGSSRNWKATASTSNSWSMNARGN
jgi:two-component system sensor histidine kinase/response regulator